MNDMVDVSIFITTYNHEKYLKFALDSVLMQKVNFKIEVLVGDDASTDKTAEVMKQYEAEYPNFFTMIYRTKNTFSDKNAISNGLDLILRCKGRYLILLEGDDYWLDPYKLQKQYDFLEEHRDYIACAHNVVVVNENNEKVDESYPECKDADYTIKHYLKEILPGQTASLMYRNIYQMTEVDTSILKKRLFPGDRLTAFVLLNYGKIFCIQEPMSAYRHIKSGGSSYSATYHHDYEQWHNYYKELVLYAQGNKQCSRKTLRSAEILYIETLTSMLKHKKISLKYALKEYQIVKYKISSFMKYIFYYIKKKK